MDNLPPAFTILCCPQHFLQCQTCLSVDVILSKNVTLQINTHVDLLIYLDFFSHIKGAGKTAPECTSGPGFAIDAGPSFVYLGLLRMKLLVY